MDRIDTLSRIRVVLSHPSHPGNIGAAARAMKTMGFTQLVLIEPRHFPDPDATAMAAGGADIVAAARVCTTLDAALADCVFAVAFSARGRDLSQPPEPLREVAPAVVEAAAQGAVALVFGNETSGLSNEELSRCQRFATIPANPAYSSLNLAASVQVACYEVATSGSAFAPPRSNEGTPATREDAEGFFEQLEASAIASGFLDPAKPGRFMERMRRLFGRSGLEREEVRLLRGYLESWRRKGMEK